MFAIDGIIRHDSDTAVTLSFSTIINYLLVIMAIRCIAGEFVICIQRDDDCRRHICKERSDIIIFYFLSRCFFFFFFYISHYTRVTRVSCNEAAINTKDLRAVALFLLCEKEKLSIRFVAIGAVYETANLSSKEKESR